MLLASNLPYSYLTVEQNDYFAKVPGSVKPDLTLAEQLSVIAEVPSRSGHEKVAELVSLLEQFWAKVQHWGVNSNRVMCFNVYNSERLYEPIALKKESSVIYPVEWQNEINAIVKSFQSFVSCYPAELIKAHFLDNLPHDFKVLFITAITDSINIRGIQYKRMTFGLRGACVFCTE